MMWESIGVFAEIVAAVAVVVSVVYLAVQIRSATEHSQAQSHTSSVSDFVPFVQWQIEDEAFATIYRNGLLDFESLAPVDRIRFSHAFYHLLMALKDMLEARDRGMMDEETYLAWENYVGAHLKMPGGGVWWSEARESWIPRVQARIDSAIERARPLNVLMPTIWSNGDVVGE